MGGVRIRPQFKYRVYERVVSTKRIRHEQIQGRRQREIAIVNKLVNERKRWKQIQAVQNKTYDYKVAARRERKDADVVPCSEDSFVWVSWCRGNSLRIFCLI